MWSGGVWKNVCEEEEEEEEVGGRGWGREESVVACKQLGFTEDNITTGKTSLYNYNYLEIFTSKHLLPNRLNTTPWL